MSPQTHPILCAFQSPVGPLAEPPTSRKVPVTWLNPWGLGLFLLCHVPGAGSDFRWELEKSLLHESMSDE